MTIFLDTSREDARPCQFQRRRARPVFVCYKLSSFARRRSVWSGTQSRTGLSVAVKILNGNLGSEWKSLQNEVSRLRELAEHPSGCAIQPATKFLELAYPLDRQGAGIVKHTLFTLGLDARSPGEPQKVKCHGGKFRPNRTGTLAV